MLCFTVCWSFIVIATAANDRSALLNEPSLHIAIQELLAQPCSKEGIIGSQSCKPETELENQNLGGR